MTVLELPVAAKLAVIPIGALLMLGQFLRDLGNQWRKLGLLSPPSPRRPDAPPGP